MQASGGCEPGALGPFDFGVHVLASMAPRFPLAVDKTRRSSSCRRRARLKVQANQPLDPTQSCTGLSPRTVRPPRYKSAMTDAQLHTVRHAAQRRELRILWRRPDDPALLEASSECPHCHTTGPVGDVFGVRTLRGQRRTQSWCRRCRGRSRRAA